MYIRKAIKFFLSKKTVFPTVLSLREKIFQNILSFSIFDTDCDNFGVRIKFDVLCRINA